MTEERKERIWLKAMEIGEKCGCHQLPERSFFIGRYQFPVCARCTGVLAGYLAGILIGIKKAIPIRLAAVFCGITLADWSLQRLEILESSNRRRLVTGFLGGIGQAAAYSWLIKKLFLKLTGNLG
ncbi:MAG: DUF2085 domain-containing protein [Ruminococcus sp.]|nr:DUF2085 domain-containing protein [Ruminococcus sp.]